MEWTKHGKLYYFKYTLINMYYNIYKDAARGVQGGALATPKQFLIANYDNKLSLHCISDNIIHIVIHIIK